MTISATAAAQRASRRFMLVRITPARYVVDDLASQGGGVYGMTWTYPVARVERNGTALTADTAAPSVNDHYYWNETAGTLQVKTASAPSTSNVVVVFYYLFYTGGKAVAAPTTPTDSATTSRVWEPRLKNFPTLNESVDNVINGVLSIADSSVALIDTDCAFKTYLTANDSFSLKDLDIWLCVDSIVDIQKVYHGRVDKVNWSDFQVTVTFTDSFLKMASPAFWGDGIDESFFFRSSTSFPNIRAADSGLPCRLLLASRSKFNFTDAVNLGAGNIYPANIEPAVCLDYSFTLDGTHNRQWGLCRTLAAPKTMSYGSSLGLVQTSGLTTATCTTGTHNLQIGDVFEQNVGGVGAAGTGTLCQVQSVSATGWVAYHLAATTLGGTLAPRVHSCPTIYIASAATPYGSILWPDKDFTTTVTSTTGGNYFTKITIVNGSGLSLGSFPATNLVNSTTLSPDNNQVGFVLDTGVDLTHGAAVSALLTKAGLTPNAAAITAANAAYTANVYTTLPAPADTNYPTYLTFLQTILASTLGYVTLNSSDEVIYKLFAAPSPSSTIDRNTIVLDSTAFQFDYADVINELTGENLYNASLTALDAGLVNYKSTSGKARYLHGIATSKTYQHVLQTIGTRLATIRAVLSARRLRLSIATATDNLSTQVGDDFTISHVALPGSSLSVKVMGISRGADKTQIDVSDLSGL